MYESTFTTAHQIVGWCRL